MKIGLQGSNSTVFNIDELIYFSACLNILSWSYSLFSIKVFSKVLANSSNPWDLAVKYANGIYPFSAKTLTFSEIFEVN